MENTLRFNFLVGPPQQEKLQKLLPDDSFKCPQLIKANINTAQERERWIFCPCDQSTSTIYGPWENCVRSNLNMGQYISLSTRSTFEKLGRKLIHCAALMQTVIWSSSKQIT
jgi:hypothetical protein